MSKDNGRIEVIENIKKYSQSGEFHNKVELNDPVLTNDQNKLITDNYIKNRNTFNYKIKRNAAVFIAKTATVFINHDTVIKGLEKIPENLSGVIITSNHFSPFENTVVRYLTNKLDKRLNIISQTSNFAMTGIIGFLMNYADTIPISPEPHYLARDFMKILKEKIIDKKEAVLLYPEQEMWFNYRKPRPPKKGAYYYAAKLNVPVLSCFVEVIDTDKDASEQFKKVRYVMHVLGLLTPDKTKNAKENSQILADRDYELKKKCYEEVYNKPLDYSFDISDIAGFKGESFEY